MIFLILCTILDRKGCATKEWGFAYSHMTCHFTTQVLNPYLKVVVNRKKLNKSLDKQN